MATRLCLMSKEDFEDLYITQQKSPQEIGDMFGVTDEAVRKYLRKFGINQRRNIKSTLSNVEIYQLHSDGISNYEIARRAGVSETAIRKRIKNMEDRYEE